MPRRNGLLGGAFALSTLTAVIPGTHWSFGGVPTLGVIAGLVLMAAPALDWPAARRVSGAALLMAVGILLPAAHEGADRHELLRLLALIAAGVCVILARDSDDPHSPAIAAAGLIGLNAALALIGALVPSWRGQIWRVGEHEWLGSLPRLNGAAGSPVACGVWLLLAVALARDLESARARRLATAVGLGLVVLTLSLPTLLLGVVFGGWWMPSGWARRLSVAALGVAAVATIWVVPHPPPADLPEAQQVGWSLAYPSSYAALARAAIGCWSTHPLLGVGPGNFPTACSVVVRTTYGETVSGERALNQYLDLLAETGIWGLACVLAAVWMLRTHFQLRLDDGCRRGCIIALLWVGFGGDFLSTLPAVLTLTSFVGAAPTSRFPSGHPRRR